jgi:excisionase family DNA binding protein
VIFLNHGGRRLKNISNPEERLAWSVDDFAKQLGVSRDLIWSQIKGGALNTIRIGTRRLIPEDERQRFLSAAKEAR